MLCIQLAVAFLAHLLSRQYTYHRWTCFFTQSLIYKQTQHRMAFMFPNYMYHASCATPYMYIHLIAIHQSTTLYPQQTLAWMRSKQALHRHQPQNFHSIFSGGGCVCEFVTPWFDCVAVLKVKFSKTSGRPAVVTFACPRLSTSGRALRRPVRPVLTKSSIVAPQSVVLHSAIR